jgi:hypothetical protein
LTKEKINEDIDHGKLRVMFKTSDKLKNSGASYLKFKFVVNENVKFG